MQSYDNGAVEDSSRESVSPDVIKISRPTKRVLKQELKAEKARIASLLDEINKLREENEMLRNSKQGIDTAITNDDVDDGFGAKVCVGSTKRTDSSINKEESMFLSSMHQLSISSLNLPECKPASEGERIQRHSFEMWRDLLIDSTKLLGISDESTMFTIFNSQQLIEIFKNTKSDSNAPDAETLPFSNALYRLRSYFGSSSDVLLQRRKLAVMGQKPDESDLSYISRVGATARLCDFEDGKEFEQIVSTIAELALRREVRVTALKLLSRNATFTNLVEKIRELEAIRLNEEFFVKKQTKSDPAVLAPVRADFPRNTASQRKCSQQAFGRNSNRSMFGAGRSRIRWNQSSGRREFGRNSDSPSRDRCWRCNSVYHLPTECDAADKNCRNCDRMGHIARACSQRFFGSSSRKRFAETDTTEREPQAKMAAIEAPKSEKASSEEVSVCPDE